jgi:hypothetical protein
VRRAEFVLDLVNKDFTSQEGVDAILDKWASGHVQALAARRGSDGRINRRASFEIAETVHG